jgi:hypothetical protein
MTDLWPSPCSRLEQSLMRCPVGSTSPGRDGWVLLGRGGGDKRTQGRGGETCKISLAEHHPWNTIANPLRRVRDSCIGIDKRRTEVYR